uniref:Uncharacterized protein n=1 Tax=Nelumbo nucifera TaxID=4432 RepID=A0A822ZWM7_NELNU|nr:TPA_asm: hypothetical protein HUJ06_004548 [Nelumbo nucifera]
MVKQDPCKKLQTMAKELEEKSDTLPCDHRVRGGQQQVTQTIVDHFKEYRGTSNPIYQVGRVIEDVENGLIHNEVNDEEIRGALFKMHPFKAPVLYVFFNFFPKSIEALLGMMSAKQMSRGLNLTFIP